MPEDCYYCTNPESVAVCIYGKGACGRVLCKRCCRSVPGSKGGHECLFHNAKDSDRDTMIRLQRTKIEKDKKKGIWPFNYFEKYGWCGDQVE